MDSVGLGTTAKSGKFFLKLALISVNEFSIYREIALITAVSYGWRRRFGCTAEPWVEKPPRPSCGDEPSPTQSQWNMSKNTNGISPSARHATFDTGDGTLKSRLKETGKCHGQHPPRRTLWEMSVGSLTGAGAPCLIYDYHGFYDRSNFRGRLQLIERGRLGLLKEADIFSTGLLSACHGLI